MTEKKKVEAIVFDDVELDDDALKQLKTQFFQQRRRVENCGKAQAILEKAFAEIKALRCDVEIVQNVNQQSARPLVLVFVPGFQIISLD